MGSSIIAALGLAFPAGILSILSPCVLLLLPIVLGAAASEHRVGPALLAGGVAAPLSLNMITEPSSELRGQCWDPNRSGLLRQPLAVSNSCT